MATHSSVLAWRIPGTGEPGGLLSMGSHSQTQLKRLSSSSSSRISWGKKKDVFQKKTFPPQTGGLLTGLEARKSKIKILSEPGSLQRLSRRILPCLSLTSSVPVLGVLSCRYITPVSASAVTWHSSCVSVQISLLRRTLVPALLLLLLSRFSRVRLCATP